MLLRRVLKTNPSTPVHSVTNVQRCADQRRALAHRVQTDPASIFARPLANDPGAVVLDRERDLGVGADNGYANLLGSAVITQRAMARNLDQTDDTYVFVKLGPGADAAQVQAVLKAGATKLFPTVDVLNQQELKDNQEQQVNTLLNLIYALLSLAVITSLFGIANTLFSFVGGWSSDKLGRKPVMVVPRILQVLAVVPCFLWLIASTTAEKTST